MSPAQRAGPEVPRPAGTSARSSSDVRLRQSGGYFHTRRNSFADTTSRHCAPAVPRCSPATSWTHQVTPLTSRKIRASRDDGGPASLGTVADVVGAPSSGGPGRASNGKCSRSEDNIGQPSSAGGMNSVMGRAGNYAARGRGRERQRGSPHTEDIRCHHVHACAVAHIKASPCLTLGADMTEPRSLGRLAPACARLVTGHQCHGLAGPISRARDGSAD